MHASLFPSRTTYEVVNLFLQNLYTAILLTSLVAPLPPIRIDSFDDIVAALADRKLTLIVFREEDLLLSMARSPRHADSATMTRFREAIAVNPPRLERDWNLMLAELDRGEKYVMVQSETFVISFVQAQCNVRTVPLNFFDIQMVAWPFNRSVDTARLMRRINTAISASTREIV